MKARESIILLNNLIFLIGVLLQKFHNIALCDEMTNHKVTYGQFYTTVNPFLHDAVFKWANQIKEQDKDAYHGQWLEPFAGANNIVEMISDVGLHEANPEGWACFDIDPLAQDENTSEIEVVWRDTLSDFPKGFKVAVTNPPYLAKNSATRRGLDFPTTDYEDLYQFSLSLMLHHCRWVAAIIPDSFITQNLFHERLFTVISLTYPMFEDTEVPVCLALFMPTECISSAEATSQDFRLYRDMTYLGGYKTIIQKRKMIVPHKKYELSFNQPEGEIGLYAVDSTTGPSIRFVLGDSISPDRISVSSRSITRIAGYPRIENLPTVIDKANLLLDKYRRQSGDIFMTSFKGLRKDCKYRRRLDWATARDILSKAIEAT